MIGHTAAERYRLETISKTHLLYVDGFFSLNLASRLVPDDANTNSWHVQTQLLLSKLFQKPTSHVLVLACLDDMAVPRNGDKLLCDG